MTDDAVDDEHDHSARTAPSDGFATSREEYTFGDDDDDEASPGSSAADVQDYTLDQLNGYQDQKDYYAVLGLPKTPPPSDGDIRSAFRLLSPQFHPDKHPGAQNEAFEQFSELEVAYEVLLDPHKRMVYDLLGEEGIRREYDQRGVMYEQGPYHDQMLGVRAMKAEEFRSWFLDKMKQRERQTVGSMVESRVRDPCAPPYINGLSAIVVSPSEGGRLSFGLKPPHLTPSNFRVKSSFRIPTPPFSMPVMLKINAGIGGSLQRLERQVEVETSTGEREARSIILPISTFTRSISLGLNGSLSVQGKLAKYLPSILQGSELEASGSIFPSPVLRLALLRSFVPVEGANPFRLTVHSTYQDSPLVLPPILDVSLVRPVGPGQSFELSWNSGMLLWPELLTETLAPLVDVGIFGDYTLMASSTSSCRIACNAHASTAAALADPSEPQTGLRKSPNEQKTPTAEAWGLEIAASSAGGLLSASYGRNIFRGLVKPAVRSEWSEEGYNKHQSRPLPAPVATRLDLQASISLDGSLGWMVHGTRKVGDFSSVGLGVGVQDQRGIVMALTWNRLGQSISIPVAICPLELVYSDTIAASIAIPWLLYSLCHYGIIRPRARRKYQAAIKRRQKELSRKIRRREAEARRAIELMTTSVSRRQAVEQETGGLLVLEAKYGKESETMVDVTIPVAALVHKGQMVIHADVDKAQMVGFYDPAPLQPKFLLVRYAFADQEHFVQARDDEAIVCPQNKHRI